MKFISVIVAVLLTSACANHQNTPTKKSTVELYGVIDSGVGVQSINR